MIRVEVYFKNENDAESARADLNKYNVHNLQVETVPEEGNEGSAPVFATSWGRTGTAIPFFSNKTEEEKAKNADPKYMSHMLRFDVKEEDYDETVAVLKNHDSYRLRTDKD